MTPSMSIAATTAVASGLVTLAMAGVTLSFHAAIRARARRAESRVRALAVDFARYLTGAVEPGVLRRASAAATGGTFWGALQRFADNIAGDEWFRLSRELHGLEHLEAECRRLTTGRPWRRALAARRLGMLDDPQGREALRRELAREGEERLTVLLALARLRDREAMGWLIAHPDVLDSASPSVAVAILKRFGVDFAGALRSLLQRPDPAGRLVIAAAEMLGVWQDAESRTALEHLLVAGGLEERIAAARALGGLGARESGPALAVALGDAAWQVRAQAARSLGRISDPGGLYALERCTRDSSWWVRRNSCYAMASLGEPGVEALARVSRSSPDRYAREMAVEALQALEWEQASPGGIGRVG